VELSDDCSQVVLDAIPAAALVTDADCRVALLNKTAEALFALPRPALLGRRLPGLATGLEWLGQALPAGIAVGGQEANLTIGHLTVPVLVDVTPLPAAGKPGGSLVVLRENSDTRESARRYEQLESLAGVGEIAAGAIHEIRNPLTSISGFIQLIQGRAARQTDQTMLDYCTLIAEEIGHINGILSDFLTLAKSAGTKFAAVDIGRLIRDVCGLMYGEAVLSRITIVPRLPDGPLLVCGNGDKIKEVLINLLRNAFHAMPDGGDITVTAAGDSGAVRVAVADTGQGMSATVMAEIFKPFYTTKETGTGLGLAICRRIMHEHRGEITVNSEEGQGTTFLLTFPSFDSCGETTGGGL
jgi:signal transduction histidine kinase